MKVLTNSVKKSWLLMLLDNQKYKLGAFLFTSSYSRVWFSNLHSTSGNILVTPKKIILMIDYRYYDECVFNKNKLYNIDEIIPVKTSYLKLLKEVCKLNNISSRIGIEGDYMTLSEISQLTINTDLTFIPFYIAKLRMQKTLQEISLLKHAAKINDMVYDDLMKMLKPGLTELQVTHFIINKMFEYGADDISFKPIVATGANAANPHHYSNNDKIQVGDLVVIDMGCIVGGYHSDSTRTFGIHKVSKELQKIYNCVYESQLRGITVLRNNILFSEIDNACRQYINDNGYGEYFVHGTGHGIGVQVHEDPYVIANNHTTKLLNNMAFTIEPGIYIPGKCGVRIEDTIIFQNYRPIVLQKTTKKLKILKNK